MPQTRIPLEPGSMYHVWTHVNGSDNIFREEENYWFFLEKYRIYIHPVVETCAYCLMPNHLHLMIGVREDNELANFLRLKKPARKTLRGFENPRRVGGTLENPSEGFWNPRRVGETEDFPKLIARQFSHLFNSYTQSFNKMHSRKGSLFMHKFNRKKIDTDPYFTALIAYIHNNPVHHGFVKEIGHWRYSSWHAYLTGKPTKLNTSEALEWFGGKKEFIAFHKEVEMEKLASLFE